MKKYLETYANINIFLGVALLVIPIAFLLYTGIINKNALNGVSADEDTETEILSEEIVDPGYKPNLSTETDVIVPSDEAVTYGNRIMIPSVGTDGLIYECTTPECGLEKGAWRIPEFNTPKNTEYPMVIAAHRWGPDNLSTAERIKNLFYSLDKVFIGDIIEVEWDGQIYRYVVTHTEENIQITRDSDDLILFTCKYYNSPVRIIVYATLVD
jgi:LPXTG-site transpeptidase (sortase) family protein